MRIALGIQYDGSEAYGWQAQTGLFTLEVALKQAIQQVAAHPIELIVAGRTDRGVHALGQVIHFDTTAERDKKSWLLGINAALPTCLSVQWVRTVSTDFHARYSALARYYRYLLCNTSARPAVFRRGLGWHYRPLSITAMQRAAQYLLGEQDFSAFRDADCQAKTAIRRLFAVEVSALGQMSIQFDVIGNAFLHHMVRNIVGTLICVGQGDRPPEWVAEVLASKQRTLAGKTMEANGLYLMAIYYPDQYGVPVQSLSDAVLGGSMLKWPATVLKSS